MLPTALSTAHLDTLEARTWEHVETSPSIMRCCRLRGRGLEVRKPHHLCFSLHVQTNCQIPRGERFSIIGWKTCLTIAVPPLQAKNKVWRTIFSKPAQD